jgi:hypothetical protein
VLLPGYVQSGPLKVHTVPINKYLLAEDDPFIYRFEYCQIPKSTKKKIEKRAAGYIKEESNLGCFPD